MEKTGKQNERLKKLLDFLKESGLIYNEVDFCKKVDIVKSFLSDMKNGRKPLSEQMVLRIVRVFPIINNTWLLSGEGAMLNYSSNGDSNMLKTRSSADTQVSLRDKVVYYPNVDASLGDVAFSENPDESSIAIFVPGFGGCLAINAKGDSMYPLIKSGEIVFITLWQESYIEWGKIYLVITKGGNRTIKRLEPSEKEGFFSCESENKEISPPFDIEYSDVVRLYLVKGWIHSDAI